MDRDSVKRNAYNIGVTAGVASLAAAGSNAIENVVLNNLEDLQKTYVSDYYKKKRIGKLFDNKLNSMPDSKKKDILSGKKVMHGWRTSRSKGGMNAINDLVRLNKSNIKKTKRLGRISAVVSALALATGAKMSHNDRSVK